MSRPKIAFIGSGGATKGIAHLGALKALEELGLRPDIYVGASSGAILAAFASQGFTADEMVNWFRPAWQREEGPALKGRHFFGLPTLAQLQRPGWLGSGMLSIDRFEKWVRENLPSNDFRHIDRQVFITATDVDGRGRVVFGPQQREDVPISQAVAASCSVPGLFRPYKIGERFYVDGELVRTLSLDLAIKAGAEVLVVSNVYRPTVTKSQERSLALRGPLSVVRQTVNIVLSEKEKRGIELIHRLYPQVTVLNVSADLGGFSFTSRRSARRLLTRGYREALRVLAAAKRRGTFDTVTLPPAADEDGVGATVTPIGKAAAKR